MPVYNLNALLAMTNSILMYATAGSHSGTAKSVIENLPPTVTPLGSSASDLLDSGVLDVSASVKTVCCFLFVSYRLIS